MEDVIVMDTGPRIRWKHYAAVTDSEGKAIVGGLPQGRMSFWVELDGYELVPNPKSVGKNTYSLRHSEIEIRPGENANVTVRMRRKK